MADAEEEILDGQLPEDDAGELDVSVTMIEATEVVETQHTKVTQDETVDERLNGSAAGNQGGGTEDIDVIEVEEPRRRMTFLE